MLCDRMDVEKPQRVPPFSFSALWDVSAPGVRGSEPRRATRSIFLVCNFFKKNSKNFRFSTSVKEYLTLGSLFAIFEPWIWRRLGPVPACLKKKIHRCQPVATGGNCNWSSTTGSTGDHRCSVRPVVTGGSRWSANTGLPFKIRKQLQNSISFLFLRKKAPVKSVFLSIQNLNYIMPCQSQSKVWFYPARIFGIFPK